MDFQTLMVLAAAGFFGGAWNATAGGATLFTFPVLLWVGLPPLVANATNFVALLPANLAALPAYRAELRSVGPALLPTVAVAVIGGAAGAMAVASTGDDAFRSLIPWLILGATGLFALGDPMRRALARVGGGAAGGYAVLTAAALYGGYFGAGAGVVILAALEMMGRTEFHVANALKNALAAALTFAGVAVFGVGGLVAWPEALVMMTSAAAGGYLGGVFIRRIDGRLLKSGVILFGLGLSLYYFAG